MILQRLIVCLMLSLLVVSNGIAANVCIRDGGTGDGSAWDNALDDLPATLTRGDTYYVADGNYATYTVNDAVSGVLVITIKKATIADHGTETGWVSTYGDGQAVFSSVFKIYASYITFDGNGTHTIPSNVSSDYGFKIDSASSDNTTGILEIGSVGVDTTNVIVRYVHIYNTTHSIGVNNGTVSIRWYPAEDHRQTKIQNCYIQNCGKDGLQMNGGSFILVERCYLERLSELLAGSPDYHGQTFRNWEGSDQVFRWNIIEACEGEALWSTSNTGLHSSRIRIYGNLIFHKTDGSKPSQGLNGGIISQAADWDGNPSDWYVYHNTIANQRLSYVTEVNNNRFRLDGLLNTGSGFFDYNNLMYNCESLTHSASSGSWTTTHNASGGLGTWGGTSEQTGLSSSIFVDYANDDYRLDSDTDAPKVLTGETWWDTSDTFFGFLDSDKDMYGVTYASRGAFNLANQPVGGGPTGDTHPRIGGILLR